VRRYWQGGTGLLSDLASRIAGSSDIFSHGGRRPRASINFITVHDGFTLDDLVSYNGKHNEANLEENRDGTDDNASWNCGVEGPTTEPEVQALRARQKRNLLTTLFLSTGVPMLLAGDEFGHSQDGNNNAYCQDNEISWIDWNGRTPEDLALTEFVKMLLRMRREHPAFARDAFFSGTPLPDGHGKDIAWLTPAGTEMTHDDWHTGGQAIGVFFGRRPLFAMLLNAGDEEVTFTLPDAERVTWGLVLATTEGAASTETSVTYAVAARSVAVFSGRIP
jgi:glycogen operon protein